MTEILGIVRAQLDALLELLEDAREAYCSQTMDRAHEDAGDYVARARKTARERVHRAVADERERMEREVRLAAAGLETEQRRLARQRDMEVIRAGWDALEQALHAHWADEHARRAWVLAAVDEAGSLLLGRDWTLEHPADWPLDERSVAERAAKERFGAKLAFTAAPDISAGLRICNGGTRIDMSPAGILAHKRAIEAELLAEVRRSEKEKPGDDHD